MISEHTPVYTVQPQQYIQNTHQYIQYNHNSFHPHIFPLIVRSHSNIPQCNPSYRPRL